MQDWKLEGDILTTTFEPGWTGEIATVDVGTIVDNNWHLSTDLVTWRVLRAGAHHTHGRAKSVLKADEAACAAWQQMRAADPLVAR